MKTFLMKPFALALTCAFAIVLAVAPAGAAQRKNSTVSSAQKHNICQKASAYAASVMDLRLKGGSATLARSIVDAEAATNADMRALGYAIIDAAFTSATMNTVIFQQLVFDACLTTLQTQ